MNAIKTMRDALLDRVLTQMDDDDSIFFLSADMGAPALDLIRERHPKRFVNVGIAEQNLISVASGLALEGCTVYTLAIAAFYLRGFEQIRNNLSISGHFSALNVNMLGVGGGISYDLSGPSHHALEDLATLRNMPNLAVVSLPDWKSAALFPDYARNAPFAKYVRLDGKPHQALPTNGSIPWQQGFQTLHQGSRVALITTGFMTQKGEKILAELQDPQIGLIDIFQFSRGLDETALIDTLSSYQSLITLHEGYLGRGGLDTLIDTLCLQGEIKGKRRHRGFPLQHQFASVPREKLHEMSGMGTGDLRQILSV